MAPVSQLPVLQVAGLTDMAFTQAPTSILTGFQILETYEKGFKFFHDTPLSAHCLAHSPDPVWYPQSIY